MAKTSSKMGQLLRSEHAVVAWRAEDVKTLRPEWTDDECNDFLMRNEEDIQCAMIERGWDAIRDLLIWEDHDR
jgi:hypothetical protein